MPPDYNPSVRVNPRPLVPVDLSRHGLFNERLPRENSQLPVMVLATTKRVLY